MFATGIPQPPRPARRDSRAPFRNLILAGYMGAARREVAAQVAAYFGAPLRDIAAEIEAREGRPPQQIRELFGEARLASLEADLCRELALQRGAVIVVGASVMLSEPNRRRLQDSSIILVLTTALNEALRRLHDEDPATYRDPTRRTMALALLKREWKVRDLPGLPHFDTTTLSIEAVVQAVIDFWRAMPEE